MKLNAPLHSAGADPPSDLYLAKDVTAVPI